METIKVLATFRLCLDTSHFWFTTKNPKLDMTRQVLNAAGARLHRIPLTLFQSIAQIFDSQTKYKTEVHHLKTY
jgi:hypothetical protein